METKALRRPRWVIGWVLGSIVGFTVGSMLVFVGGWSILESVTGDADRILDDGVGFFLYLTAAFTVGGAGLATGQWLLLRRRVPHVAGRWVLGGAAGFAIVAIGYFALYERVPELLNDVVHNLAGGVVMGAIQIPVVRRLTGRSRGWLMVAAASMIIAGTISALVRSLGGTDDLGGPLGVASATLLTGFVLSRWIADTMTPGTSAPAATASGVAHEPDQTPSPVPSP